MKIIAGIVNIVTIIFLTRAIVATLKEPHHNPLTVKSLLSFLIGTLLCGSGFLLSLVFKSGNYRYISIILVVAGLLAVCLGTYFTFKRIREIEADDNQDN